VSDAATGWPRRKRSAVDDAMLTVAGCSHWLADQRGSLNGFYDPAAPTAVDGWREGLSQRRDRAYARAWRLRIGPEQWQELADAYADEIRQNLEDENRIHDRREAK
jgi:hypothetical protein